MEDEDAKEIACGVATVAALIALVAGPAARPRAAQTTGQDTQTVMQSGLGKQVRDGCNAELVKYCAEVTPARGACLPACMPTATSTGPCEFALYDAAARLERAINTITYVASECRSEIPTRCANVRPGEGRIGPCLKDHPSALSPGCDQALTSVGVKYGKAPAGFAPLAIGLALTLIHLVSTPVANTSVNPACSTGVASSCGCSGWRR